ncbi:MAG: hypothetical protein CVU89_02440 [Firmicutes bacterium HGW-Firmicutes-14]|nr:MAG: hypothetical protein CVU89_02440 [Firmicutes bacterium HGW-Firmicutes-14]
MKDNFLRGTAAGFTGAVVMSVFDFILNLIPGINIELIFGISKLFVPRSMTGTLAGSTVGLISHLVCGILVGLVMLVILEIAGYDYLLAKGAIMGLASWFLLCGILGKALGLRMQDRFIDNLLIMLIHIPFGLTVVWFLDRFRPKPEVTG